MPIQFTVFTPTYNQPRLIERVFRSLLAQTYTGFEWLIIDDGSALDCSPRIREWQRRAMFPIRYEVQQHQGKHYAHNKAIAQARGELFAVLDDDDAIVPHALERLLFHWHSIPRNSRRQYSGVSCLCMDGESKIIGAPFPRDVLDCPHYELESRFQSTGERWGFHRIEVLRQFPFPTIRNESYCPEGLVWNRIAQQYLVRHVNEPLRIFFRRAGNMSSKIRTVLMHSPQSARMFYQECLQLSAPPLWKCKQGINYVRYSWHAGVPPSRIIRDSGAPGITAAFALAGYACYAIDRLRAAPAPLVTPGANE